MISINDNSFFDEFSVHNMTVGIVGFGYVGQAIDSFFSNKCKTLVYDKYKKEQYKLDDLEDVVAGSHVIFVAVPTPMNKDGSCNTDIVSSVFEDIKNAAIRTKRSLEEFVVVLKSTVEPGFTNQKRQETGLRLIFSPEFLTEKNSIDDFKNTNRVLFGGEEKDCMVVKEFFMKGLGERTVLGICDNSTSLEMVKLFANSFLATKVIFANEMYELCKKMDLDYEEIMLLACLDPRISRSHLSVPGHDGKQGFGGSCFPKDLNGTKFLANKYNTKEKMFTSVLDRNVEVRGEKDWEKLKGRAVIDDE